MPSIPRRVMSVSGESLEDVAFLSGAALAELHAVVTNPAPPHSLLRERLALGAATACAGFAGRMETAADLRDAVHLLRAGDHPGPAGALYLQWRRAVTRKASAKHLASVLPDHLAPHAAFWLKPGQGTPVAQAARVLEAILKGAPRAEAEALIMADAVLAQAMGWDHPVPLLAAGLPVRALRLTGDDLRLACHKAVTAKAQDAAIMALDLARRAGCLQALSPKLRAKGADAAIALFLSHDALSPSLALTGLMSDRAARRLCDRLVALGALRELTGRATFRLYGV
ncbi:DUF1403 family protein (plasmid) [Paracoccus albus]|nr:DUF1403 family protein [Paracoccus albus]WBU62374.1 DUF1403 family protein [Paracoccus albus]